MPEETKKDELGDFLRAYDEYLDGKRGYHEIPTLGGGPRLPDVPARVIPTDVTGGTVRRTRLREELPRLCLLAVLWGVLLGASRTLHFPDLALGIEGAAAVVALSLAGVNASARMGRFP